MEQAQRRQELAALYGSLDTLLGLGGAVKLNVTASPPLLAGDDADLSADSVGRMQRFLPISWLTRLRPDRECFLGSRRGLIGEMPREVRGREGGRRAARRPSSRRRSGSSSVRSVTVLQIGLMDFLLIGIPRFQIERISGNAKNRGDDDSFASSDLELWQACPIHFPRARTL